MDLFHPLRDFRRRRQLAKLDALATHLQLVELRRDCARGNFVFPGPDIAASIERAGQRVGVIHYGLSPLDDRVYISDFRIARDQQGQGLGLATLWRLWQQHQVPLTPLHEVGSSLGFWAKARQRLAAAGVELTQDIRTAEQDGEQQRWQHLVPEPEHERLIRELMASPEWPAIKARFDAEYNA
ncbi:N-acetyltransferase [Pseudomonas mosselii]|uniref:N-acetyltransferase n=1 Tax=Pseudomonas mosselii TaxID=78327 RepID=UPI00260F1954|nr:N-acetyltransferase [Pseudomonas mosselii]MDN4500143.1 N-acetyltransferase [Pseudomonas mosselii]